MIMKQLTTNNGQAATEFVIAAAAVLVPLFLIIPLIGKYTDVRHALIQQARYEAWEYTVWYGPSEHVMYAPKSPSFNPDENRVAAKPFEQTRHEAKLYYFSNLFAKNYDDRDRAFERNPLWKDHRGKSLFAPSSKVNITGPLHETDTPDPTAGILSTILKGFNWLTSAYGSLVTKFKKDGGKFDAVYTKGFYKSNPKIELHSLEAIFPHWYETQPDESGKKNRKILTMEGRASVISNYWNSGSTDQAVSESKGLVFSGILAPIVDVFNKVIETVQRGINFAQKILPLDIKLPMFPKFGYVDEDLIPYEHLDESDSDGDKKHKHKLDEVSGLYYYKKES